MTDKNNNHPISEETGKAVNAEKKQGGFIRALGTVSGFTLLSRFLGLFRDMTLARVFGAGGAQDAFLVAFKIPNLFRRFFAEGAFHQAFVPVLAEYKEKYELAEMRLFVQAASGLLGAFLLLLTVLAIVFSEQLAFFFAPGFKETPEKFEQVSEMIRWTFPYLFFISLTALYASVLNTYQKFAVPAVAPVVLNLCLIVAALFFTSYLETPIYVLAYAVLVAGVLQWLTLWPSMKALKLLAPPKWSPKHPGVRKVGVLILPAIFGVSMAQISMLINQILASYLPDGSVSWLYFADRLMELPVGLLGVALGTVALPALAKAYQAGKSSETGELSDKFKGTLDWSLKLTLMLGLPAACGLWMLSEPLMLTLFTYNEFTPTDAAKAANALRAYAFGLLGLLLIKVLAPAFYARQNTKTPVKIASLSLLTNIVVAFLLYKSWAHVGLAAATSIGAMLNATLLFAVLYRTKVYPRGALLFWLLKLLVASSAMVACLLYLPWEIVEWVEWSGFERVGVLLLSIGLGGVSYFLALFVLRLPLRHFWRQRPIG
jgi:putative peptidoglycan lipid II flippase